jgi:hypothetical protein
MPSNRSIDADALSAGVASPTMSLRGGNARDEYREPPPFDPELDRPTPEYLERYFWGIAHLDAESWRYYLPMLIEHTLQNVGNPRSMAVDAFLASLRPPDREPPRLESLSAEQKAQVIALLDRLAFEDGSAWKSQAMTALEEYWAPGALYRSSREA